MKESNTAGCIVFDKSICAHNYRYFKKDENWQKMIEKCLDRWGKLGFIDGLHGELRERCAIAMEQLAAYLLSEDVEKELTGDFETIGFPMIRIVCCGSVGNQENLNDPDLFDFEKFIEYCKELDTNKLIGELNEISENTGFDVEAEVCTMACEMIINRFNGDERSFDEIKTEYINKIKGKINEKHERNCSNHTNV